MKILTRNVNGIRAVTRKGFLDIMQEEDPDIICLQETKAFHHQCPPELRILPQNNMYRHAGQRPGYAGTAILSKFAMVDHTNEFDHSHKFYEDGRITEVELPDNILLLSIYFPNGGTRADGTEMLTYKLSFYDELTAYVQQKQQAGYELILTGDFNICHTEIDIARPKENAKTIGFLPIERQRIGDFMQECSLTDMFRYFYPDKVDEYTWWSLRSGARQRNVGRRIDYFMLTPGLVKRTKEMKHRQDIMGSDHCPIELVLS